MSKSYIVNLVYGYVQSDYGVEHSFLFLPPSATEGDREQERAYLMDELDCTEEDIANGRVIEFEEAMKQIHREVFGEEL